MNLTKIKTEELHKKYAHRKYNLTPLKAIFRIIHKQIINVGLFFWISTHSLTLLTWPCTLWESRWICRKEGLSQWVKNCHSIDKGQTCRILKWVKTNLTFSWHSGFEGHKFLHLLAHFGQKKKLKMSCLDQDSNLQSIGLKSNVLATTP